MHFGLVNIEDSHHLPVGFAADNADATDFRGFFGLKKDLGVSNFGWKRLPRSPGDEVAGLQNSAG